MSGSGARDRPGLVRFGVFEADLAAGELRRSGRLVPLRPQPFAVLAYLLERPGELVTRDELRERIWGSDVHVDFDRSLNTALARVREALDDSPRLPVYVETVPRRGYRFIYPLTVGAEAAEEPRSPWLRWAGAGVAAAAIVTALAFNFDSSGSRAAIVPAEREIPRTARQLTTDLGLSAWPHISRDGKRVVFASDRDGGPDLDIWLLEIARGALTQLTDDPGDEFQPQLSPDDSRVVYTSTRGITVWSLPLAGGKPRLVSEGAWNPHISPDGKTIAMTQLDRERGFSANLLLTAPDGSDRRSINHGLRFFGSGILWLPDGRLLAGGNPAGSIKDGQWYVLQPDGSQPQSTEGAQYVLSSLGISRPTPYAPQAWLEPEQAIVISARKGDSIDLWKLPFALEEGLVTGPPRRFTVSGSFHYDVSAAPGGRVVHSSARQNIDLWRLPLDPSTGAAAGPPERLTRGLGAERSPTVSRDGTTVAFLASASAANSALHRIQIGRLDEFEPEPFSEAEGDYRVLHLSTDGSRVYYGAGGRGVVVDRTDGVERTACDDCRRVLAWSPDGRYLIYRSFPGPLQLLDIEAGKERPLTLHDTYLEMNVRFSPDQRWIAFDAMTRGMTERRVFVMRFDPDRTVPAEDWIAITGEGAISRAPVWSFDGDRVYYFSTQGGPLAIWTQALDPETKKPQGQPALVYEGGGDQPRFHFDFMTGAGWALMTAGKDFLLFDTIDMRGNIWLLEPAANLPAQ